MKIGEVIRKHRKEMELTQEEMARRLGVTAPAVNKWENGNSMPDITLLAPIARLLAVSLDELLSFREELTEQEADFMIEEVRERSKTQEYAEVFAWARQQMEKYPNCERLQFGMAMSLYAQALFQNAAGQEEYEEYCKAVFERLMKSRDESMRSLAADALYSWYFRKEEYDRAEEYLKDMKGANPEKKLKQAALYERRGMRQEAFRTYEELLFYAHNLMQMIFPTLFQMHVQEKEYEEARFWIEKTREAGRMYGRQDYMANALELQLAQEQHDVEKTLFFAKKQLEMCCGKWMNVNMDSPLCAHMKMRDLPETFYEQARKDIRQGFRGKEFDYMKGCEAWEEFLNG